ncbi:MAG: protein tyrosine phosphatase family protein [Woeseiaceae bacterium]
MILSRCGGRTRDKAGSENVTILKHCLALVALGIGIGVQTNSALAQSHGNDVHAGPMMNYHEIDDRLSTGGHFVGDGLAVIRDKGVEVVIDLRDKPPGDQKEKLAKQGIEWINIPVVWKDPKGIDYERFSAAMSKHKDRNVLVQCQANYRASAMTYLYRVNVEKVARDVAAQDLNAVWEPEGRWREYMDGILK